MWSSLSIPLISFTHMIRECIKNRNWCTPASESKNKFYAIRICCFQLSLPPRRHAKTASVDAKYEHIERDERSEWETISRDYK